MKNPDLERSGYVIPFLLNVDKAGMSSTRGPPRLIAIRRSGMLARKKHLLDQPIYFLLSEVQPAIESSDSAQPPRIFFVPPEDGPGGHAKPERDFRRGKKFFTINYGHDLSSDRRCWEKIRDWGWDYAVPSAGTLEDSSVLSFSRDCSGWDCPKNWCDSCWM